MKNNKAVNVVGAGLSGLSAAIRLARQGICCNLISSQPSERAQSVLAEGGINAALDTMGENDSPAEHFADTMRGGCFLEAESAVRGLTENAPEIVRGLVKLGAPLTQKDGRLQLRNFGGQKKKRTAYAKSSTGKALMTALIDEARKYEAAGLIRRFPHHELTGFEIRDGVLGCITVLDAFSEKTFRFGGCTILCCGGLNGFFEGHTTGTTQNTGNAAAAAFAAGVQFANLEFIQFHPTTVGISGKRLLISEAARGEGGRLFIRRDGMPWYFMEEMYPELGNLAPRDVISREMFLAAQDPACGGDVFLDLTALKNGVWETKLSDLRAEILSYLHLDPKREPIPVRPGIHFFMGGVRVNDRHETNVKGLYAAGEAACKYHGANRLGGNSMLAALYSGGVAAQSAAAAAGAAHISEVSGEKTSVSDPARRRELGEILYNGLGIVRNAKDLTAAKNEILRLSRAETIGKTDRNRLLLGLAMVESALFRKESRGAHFRSDFPETKDAFRKQTCAALCGQEIRIGLVPAEEEVNGAWNTD